MGGSPRLKIFLDIQLLPCYNTKIEKVQKSLEKKTVTMDSTLIKIESKIITEDKMITLIKEIPNWKTLELEELSDKNRIPINKLKNDNEK